MMRQHHFDIINYIDDIIGINVPSKVFDSFNTLQNLLQSLGFQLPEKKIVQPTGKINCLGIMVDTENFTTSIPAEKLQEIWETCISWKGRKT